MSAEDILAKIKRLLIEEYQDMPDSAEKECRLKKIEICMENAKVELERLNTFYEIK